jgi:hypothetical protein
MVTVMDIRTVSRYGAAASMIVSSLALAIPITYVDTDDSGATQIHDAVAHIGMVTLSNALLPLQILLIPALIYVARLARRNAPRLAYIGAALSTFGWMAGLIALGGSGIVVYQATTMSDRNAAATLVGKFSQDSTFGTLTGLFVLGFMIGLVILGIALWHSHAVPVWVAVLFILVPIGDLLGHFASSTVAIVDGYAFVVCLVMCAIAVLRRADDEWDLSTGTSPVPVPAVDSLPLDR